MFNKYPKTYRILIPQVSTKGKHYLSGKETKQLLSGTVVITEKLDGANTGIIRHKDYFKLQKRGSLVDVGEHEQFNMLKAWSQINYDKLIKIPDKTILYGEWCYAKHTVFYDMLPSYFIAFAWWNRNTDTFYHYDDMAELCDKIGLSYVPELYRGSVAKNDLFDLIPDPSTYGHEPAEGLVVFNHRNQMRGKVVREEFQQSMDHEGHWARKEIVKNIISDKCSCK